MRRGQMGSLGVFQVWSGYEKNPSLTDESEYEKGPSLTDEAPGQQQADLVGPPSALSEQKADDAPGSSTKLVRQQPSEPPPLYLLLNRPTPAGSSIALVRQPPSVPPPLRPTTLVPQPPSLPPPSDSTISDTPAGSSTDGNCAITDGICARPAALVPQPPRNPPGIRRTPFPAVVVKARRPLPLPKKLRSKGSAEASDSSAATLPHA